MTNKNNQKIGFNVCLNFHRLFRSDTAYQRAECEKGNSSTNSRMICMNLHVVYLFTTNMENLNFSIWLWAQEDGYRERRIPADSSKKSEKMPSKVKQADSTKALKISDLNMTQWA